MQTDNKLSCPLCNNSALVSGNNLLLQFDCPLCGHYKILSRVIEDLKNFPKHILSGLARNYWESQKDRFYFSAEVLQSMEFLSKAVPFAIPHDTDIPAKADLILHHLCRKSEYPGQCVALSNIYDLSIPYSRHAEELNFCASYLMSRHFITPEPNNGPDDDTHYYTITPDGWAYLSGIGTEAKDQGFIAMAFRLPTSDVLHTGGLNPGILNAGYSPLRIDRKDHNNRIDDEIVAEIRKSKFVVADLTGKNAGAYFEAGFAQGLGKPVIWTCQQSEIDAGNVHFDTRQYSIVSWEPDKLDDFAKRLTQRIEATIGRGRYVPA